MCGIIGFVGNEPAAPILLDGLERMEYRGYDSAGVAVRSETAGLQVRKTKGRLQVLSDLIHGGADLEGNLGIGHTRWATHGEPNDINAHPHVSENGQDRPGPQRHHRKLSGNQGAPHAPRASTSPPTRTRRWWPSCMEYPLSANAATCWRLWAACLRRIEGSYALGIICARLPQRRSLPPGRTAP